MTRPLGMLQDREVIGEADPAARLEVGQRGVGEAEIDGAQQRPAGDGGEHDQHRRQEQPRRARRAGASAASWRAAAAVQASVGLAMHSERIRHRILLSCRSRAELAAGAAFRPRSLTGGEPCSRRPEKTAAGDAGTYQAAPLSLVRRPRARRGCRRPCLRRTASCARPSRTGWTPRCTGPWPAPRDAARR